MMFNVCQNWTELEMPEYLFIKSAVFSHCFTLEA